MNTDIYSAAFFLQTICSAGVGMVVTALLLRRKNRAETLLAHAQKQFADVQTQFTGVEIYSQMLKDLKLQLDNQAEQILMLQKKEAEYIKIINGHNNRERVLTQRVKQLESEISLLKSQLKNV